MKKRILGLVIITVFITTISLNFNLNKKDRNINLMKANIEALASSGEGGSSGGTHTMTCGNNGIKLCKGKCLRCQIELEAWGSGPPVSIYCPL